MEIWLFKTWRFCKLFYTALKVVPSCFIISMRSNLLKLLCIGSLIKYIFSKICRLSKKQNFPHTELCKNFQDVYYNSKRNMSSRILLLHDISTLINLLCPLAVYFIVFIEGQYCSFTSTWQSRKGKCWIFSCLKI